jgi:hypothetical protein
MKKTVFLLSLLLVSFFFASVSFADLDSTNYKITQSNFSGGTENLGSTNYSVKEGILDFFTKENITSTNYQTEGTVGIEGQNAISVVSTVTPADYARFYTDESASFTVTAVDPDSDTLEYQARQDGTIKAGPQSSNVLTWTLGSSDKGRHEILLEVLDPDGTVSAVRRTYIFRRPVK